VTFTDYYDDKAETIDFSGRKPSIGKRIGTGFAMMNGKSEYR
jgi:hypothetical protein